MNKHFFFFLCRHEHDACKLNINKKVKLQKTKRSYMDNNYINSQTEHTILNHKQCNTVKPVLRGHPWDKEKVSF